MGILKECAHVMKKCVIVVTHSNDLAKQADVVFRLKKGELLQLWEMSPNPAGEVRSIDGPANLSG